MMNPFENSPPPEATTQPIPFGYVLEQLAKLLIRGWANMFYPFLRFSFGRQYLQPMAWGGLLVLWVWAGMTAPSLSLQIPHGIFAGGFLFLACAHTLFAKDFFRGSPLHSFYTGYPLVCLVLPISEGLAKCFVEPLCIFMLSGIVNQWSHSLGGFVAIGGIMCMFDNLGLKLNTEAKARQLRNAELEHEAIMDTYDRKYR